MTNATLESPENKKVILMSLIDDMTASAIDRSTQGHLQFLQLRTQLIETIDQYAKEERKQIDAIKAAIKHLYPMMPGLFSVS